MRGERDVGGLPRGRAEPGVLCRLVAGGVRGSGLIRRAGPRLVTGFVVGRTRRAADRHRFLVAGGAAGRRRERTICGRRSVTNRVAPNGSRSCLGGGPMTASQPGAVSPVP